MITLLTREQISRYDIHVILKNSPGSLGNVLGENGVGLEGGGLFTMPEAGHAHFRVGDGADDGGIVSIPLKRPILF